jgi:hypothetical protein
MLMKHTNENNRKFSDNNKDMISSFLEAASFLCFRLRLIEQQRNHHALLSNVVFPFRFD